MPRWLGSSVCKAAVYAKFLIQCRINIFINSGILLEKNRKKINLEDPTAILAMALYSVLKITSNVYLSWKIWSFSPKVRNLNTYLLD